jgi:RNA polymerase sigma factor (sigma-70 family)
VAGHRALLDWLLRVPEWTAMYAQGIAELNLPGQRQGIAFNAALMSLPIECKYELIRWVVGAFRGHLHAEVGQQMCRLLGMERFNRLELDEFLTNRQWLGIKDDVLFRLSRSHWGYKDAQGCLFAAFRPVIEGIVVQCAFRADLRADCAQEGALGLLAAIDRINETDENFSAYAAQWIRRFVRNHLLRQRLPVHVPVNLISRAAMSRHCDDRTTRAPCPEAVIQGFLRHPALSLDEPMDAGGGCLAEGLADMTLESPGDTAARVELSQLVVRALDLLTEKQREVIVQRYGLEGRTVAKLTEIARHFGISHQQAGMRERRALLRLQSALGAVASEIYAAC